MLPAAATQFQPNQIHSHQEVFYAFATLSIDPEELRENVKRSHHIDWDPTANGRLLSDQLTFIGLYDGCVDLLIYPKTYLMHLPAMVVPPYLNISDKSFMVY